MIRSMTESQKLMKAIEIAKTIQRQMAKDEARRQAPPSKQAEPHLMRDAANEMMPKHNPSISQVQDPRKKGKKLSNINRFIGYDPDTDQNEEALRRVKAASEGLLLEEYDNRGKQWYEPNDRNLPRK